MNGRKINILLIEDNPGDVRLIHEMLAGEDKTCILESVNLLSAGIDRILQDGIDVVLLDLGLSNSSGIDTLRRLKKKVLNPPAIVVMSGLGDEEVAVQAVQEGAQDYLIKGFVDTGLLMRSMRYAIERHKTDAALRESERHYRCLFDTMLQGVICHDAEGNIVSMNPAAERILGRTSEQLLGCNLISQDSALIRSDGFPMSADDHPVNAVLRTGKEISNVTMGVFNPHENRYRWINLSVIPLLAIGEHKTRQVYAIFDDITERKRSQEELELAKAAAEAANEVKSRFLASISHEIRTPLNAIIVTTDILLESHLNNEQRDGIDTIRSSSEILLALINDILDLSKIEADRMDLDSQAFDIRQCIEESLDQIVGKAEEKKLEIVYYMQEDVPDQFIGDKKPPQANIGEFTQQCG